MKRIVYKKTDEWYIEWQRITTRGTTSDNEWQRMKTSDNEWPFWQKLFNNTLNNKEFPDELKLADVTPIYKKDDPNKSKNYIPVSVLPAVSNVFEKKMYDQISQYISIFLTPYLCGYRK